MPRPEKKLEIPKDGILTPRLAFAQILRERRKALKLTQTDLEDVDQVNAAYISLLELGKRQVCLDTFMYLAKRLQMKPSDLMREIETRTGMR